MTENNRQVVIPGEVIVKGDDFLPGEGTEKRNEGIVALRFGLSEESNKLIRVIPLSGPYQPRRGNVVVGKVELITANGWVINIKALENAFLPVAEVPRFVHKSEMDNVMSIGDTIVAKIWGIGGRGIDLSIRSRGFGKVDEGIVVEINPNKVPRIIGKEGSMIRMIKDETKCNITVGQNGLIWIKGDNIEDELFAKRAVEFVAEKSFMSGLTEKVEKWFSKNKGGKNDE